jgi:hypothetical protein
MERTGIRTQSHIERVHVKNVMNPLLWICGLVSAPSAIAVAASAAPTWVPMALATVPVAVTLLAYVYFMFTQPDRLQSEGYQLRKQALELIEEKGSLAIVEATTIEIISNPDLPALTGPAKEDK